MVWGMQISALCWMRKFLGLSGFLFLLMFGVSSFFPRPWTPGTYGEPMSELQQIETPNAPGAVGAYSQGIAVGDLVFVSGSLPIDPVSRAMPEDVKAQANLALTNVKGILEAAGSGMDKVVKATIFLANIDDFGAVNEVYSTFFTKPYPARSCFAVAALPLGAKLEIEVIATK